MELNEGWTRQWNNDQLIPYAYDKLEWVAYEDIQSLTEKVKKKLRFMKLLPYFFILFNLNLFKVKLCKAF